MIKSLDFISRMRTPHVKAKGPTRNGSNSTNTKLVHNRAERSQGLSFQIYTQASTKSGNRHRDGGEGVSQVVVRFPRKARRVVESSLIIVINIILILMKPEDL